MTVDVRLQVVHVVASKAFLLGGETRVLEEDHLAQFSFHLRRLTRVDSSCYFLHLLCHTNP